MNRHTRYIPDHVLPQHDPGRRAPIASLRRNFEHQIGSPKATSGQAPILLDPATENPTALASTRGSPVLDKQAVEKSGIPSLTRASPWKSCKPIYCMKYDRFVTIAVRQLGHSRQCVMVKTMGEQEVYKLRTWKHERLLAPLETFLHVGVYHVVFPRMTVSLGQIVAAPPYPSEQELAAILGQVKYGVRDFQVLTGHRLSMG